MTYLQPRTMGARRRLLAVIPPAVLAVLAVASCGDPTGPSSIRTADQLLALAGVTDPTQPVRRRVLEQAAFALQQGAPLQQIAVVDDGAVVSYLAVVMQWVRLDSTGAEVTPRLGELVAWRGSSAGQLLHAQAADSQFVIGLAAASTGGIIGNLDPATIAGSIDGSGRLWTAGSMDGSFRAVLPGGGECNGRIGQRLPSCSVEQVTLSLDATLEGPYGPSAPSDRPTVQQLSTRRLLIPRQTVHGLRYFEDCLTASACASPQAPVAVP